MKKSAKTLKHTKKQSSPNYFVLYYNKYRFTS